MEFLKSIEIHNDGSLGAHPAGADLEMAGGERQAALPSKGCPTLGLGSDWAGLWNLGMGLWL